MNIPLILAQMFPLTHMQHFDAASSKRGSWMVLIFATCDVITWDLPPSRRPAQVNRAMATHARSHLAGADPRRRRPQLGPRVPATNQALPWATANKSQQFFLASVAHLEREACIAWGNNDYLHYCRSTTLESFQAVRVSPLASTVLKRRSSEVARRPHQAGKRRNAGQEGKKKGEK